MAADAAAAFSNGAPDAIAAANEADPPMRTPMTEPSVLFNRLREAFTCVWVKSIHHNTSAASSPAGAGYMTPPTSQARSGWHAFVQGVFSSFIGARTGTGASSPGSSAGTSSSFAMSHSQLRADDSEIWAGRAILAFP